MYKRRLVAGLMALSMVAVGLVGCSQRAQTQPSAGAVEQTPSPTPVPTYSRGDDKTGKMTVMSIDDLDIDLKNDKVIALTFDDGPNPINTVSLLETLKEEDVPATFFVLGELVEQYPEVVEQAFKQGCEIGSHTYDHKQLTKLSEDQVLEEIDKTSEAVKEATGYTPIIIRPPYGSVNETVQSYVDQAFILWDVDTLDWKSKDPDQIDSIVMKNVKDGDVILMHDIYGTTGKAVARVIPKLKEEGFKFVTVTQLMQIQALRGEKIDYVRGETDYIVGDIEPLYTPEPSASSSAKATSSAKSSASPKKTSVKSTATKKPSATPKRTASDGDYGD